MPADSVSLYLGYPYVGSYDGLHRYGHPGYGSGGYYGRGHGYGGIPAVIWAATMAVVTEEHFAVFKQVRVRAGPKRA